MVGLVDETLEVFGGREGHLVAIIFLVSEFLGIAGRPRKLSRDYDAAGIFEFLPECAEASPKENFQLVKILRRVVKPLGSVLVPYFDPVSFDVSHRSVITTSTAAVLTFVINIIVAASIL